MNNQIEQAIKFFKQSKRAVALTGAGISTPSGIPDFRSPSSGLWNKYDPMVVASIDGFKRRPEEFYRWIHPLADLILHAEPNAAHMALTENHHHPKYRSVTPSGRLFECVRSAWPSASGYLPELWLRYRRRTYAG